MLELLEKGLFIVEIVLGLGLLIFIHELGHFLVAKRHKVRVEAFSLGFGPIIWKKRKGETEYRISWIPLGGYVKMAGESVGGERTGKPDELTSKSAWQRFQIFVAGALMNLLIAFPICIIAFLAGKYEFSPEVGVPGKAETYAGMKPGDVIVSVDGVAVKSADHYRIEMLRKPKGEAIPVTVLRDGTEVQLRVMQEGSEARHGVPVSTRIPKVKPGSVLAKAGVLAGDEIIAVNGVRVYTGHQLVEDLQEQGGKEVALRIRRRREGEKKPETFDLKVVLPKKDQRLFPQEASLLEPVVGKVPPGQPAAGKVEPEDVVLRIEGVDPAVWKGLRDRLRATEPARAGRLYEERDGNKAWGFQVKSWQDLKDMVEPSVDRVLRFEIKRGAEKKWVEIRPSYGQTGKGMIGVEFRPTKRIAEVTAKSFYRGKFEPGDALVSFDGKAGDLTVLGTLFAYRFGGDKKSVSVVVRRGGKQVNLDLLSQEKPVCDFGALGLRDEKGDLALEVARIFRKRSMAESIKDGLYEPVNITILTFQLLRKLVIAEESAKGLAGPVGIFQVSYRSAELAPGNLLWLLALITVNLGIFNLLPIPVLDGGHVVLLAIEKLRGKPPSERFIAIFQYVGLVFLLALIIFVTYNDISRLMGG